MSWRPIREADLLACLAIQPSNQGDKLVGLEAALEVWRGLLRDPFFIAVAFESDPPIGGHSLIGFGASAFVSTEFMGAEIANPRPDINSRIIATVRSGKSVLLTRDELASANAGEGVDSVILYGSWREEILSASESVKVQMLLPSCYTELHAGYRIRRILWETACAHEERFARSSGVYRAIGEFPDLSRALNIMSSVTAAQVAGSLGNVICTYTEPVLRLRQSDQQLLLAAQNGATDLELTAKLGLRLPAVKARWRSTFARVALVRSDLVNDQDTGNNRGLQKRHGVLAYVREHPEELRPYTWQNPLPERRRGTIHQAGT
jgi:hypothetical protein